MPAPSETSIANGALVLLGERRINSLDDPNSKTAKILKDRFDEVRDELLRQHPWNFATKRVALPANVTAPIWGFDHAYSLPEDCLRVLELSNPGLSPYRIEGRTIVTDIDAPINLEYTSRVTDATQMDVMFRQVLSAALAADVAEAITGTTTKVDQLEGIKRARLRSARTPDGQEPSPRRIESSEWLDAREISGPTRTVPSGGGTPL
jgi:hypothetical protein